MEKKDNQTFLKEDVIWERCVRACSAPSNSLSSLRGMDVLPNETLVLCALRCTEYSLMGYQRFREDFQIK